jgi:hypothetical protein
MRFYREDSRRSPGLAQHPGRGHLLAALALTGLGIAMAMAMPGATTSAQATPAKAGKPKYYFNVTEIQSTVASDAVKATAKEILAKDLAARPQFTADLGGATAPDEVAAELRRRKLAGFLVTMNIEKLSREPRPPKPGGRLSQLAVGVKVSVFGTTIPEAKLAFGGDGEAEIVAEVVERRMDEETASLTNDVLVQAVKQAVDQAVAKLSMPVSRPFNESKRRKAKGPKP